MAGIEDPRHYLTIKPVPAWGMAKDAKLKARSIDQYNLGSPTRYDMFKNNYMRRLRQMTSQGFMSSPSKPYQPVGNLILNSKDLVKKTLGQYEENEQSQSPRRKSMKEETATTARTSRSERFYRRPMTAPIASARASARNRKPLHQLHDIPQSLNVVENTKYSVKMGHSLFEVLETKPASTPMYKVSKGQCTGKDDDVTDGPVMRKQSVEEVEIQPGPKSLVVPQWLVSITNKPSVRIAEDNNLHSDSYTSIDSILLKSENKEEPKTYFLWRQLCALHWLIEACRVQQGLRSIPYNKTFVELAKCWDVVEPGGKTEKNETQYAKSLERIGSTSSLRLPSRSVSRSSSTSTMYGGRTSPKGFSSPITSRRTRESSSFREVLTSREMSTSQENPFSPLPTPTIVLPDDTSVNDSDVFDVDDATSYHGNLVKLLDTVKESVQKELAYRERIADDEAERKQKLRCPVYKWALVPYPKTPRGVRPVTASVNVDDTENIRRPSSIAVKKPAIRPHTAGPRMKCSARKESFRSESSSHLNVPVKKDGVTLKRPRSSPPKVTLRLNTASFSSDQREKTMVKLREQFKEVTDMKALRLHQSLTELQRSRIERMEKKFEAFDACQLSIDRDLKWMRSAATKEGGSGRSSNWKASLVGCASECEWFTKLLEMSSVHEATDKPCKKVFEYLRKSAAQFMGWQEDGLSDKRGKPTNIMDHQITVESFVKVLRQLRSFEIFAPDVSAAVEFMKNNIVKMPKEQFEEVIKRLV